MTTPAMSNEDLVRQFLATAEKFYGVLPPVRATFEVQEVSGELHAEWDKERNHVTIRIQQGWDDYQRKGRLAHESFHVFSPATLSEATYLDEGTRRIACKALPQLPPFSRP